jgi:1-acyl-sn-glycerol-3-phosphate acyltransferase
MLYAILKPLTALLARLLFGLEVRGTEHVPREGAILVVANHASNLDPPLIGCRAPRQFCFLAKEELFRIPLFGRLIHALNARPLRREGADPRAVRTALRLLDEGKALLLFPEGTRGEEGTLRAAKAGAGMLAVMSGVPVVPAYIRGSGTVWPRGRKLPRTGKVIVSFGSPLRFERGTGPERKERYEAASRAMMDAIARLMPASEDAELEPVGGAGLHAQGPPKYRNGRNGQHG